MPKRKDKTDDRINRAYMRTCSGVQINMMDIPRIFASVRAVIKPDTTDAELDMLVKATVDNVRVN